MGIWPEEKLKDLSAWFFQIVLEVGMSSLHSSVTIMCQPLDDKTNYSPLWNVSILDYKIQCFQEFISHFSKPACSEKCQLFPLPVLRLLTFSEKGRKEWFCLRSSQQLPSCLKLNAAERLWPFWPGPEILAQPPAQPELHHCGCFGHPPGETINDPLQPPGEIVTLSLHRWNLQSTNPLLSERKGQSENR